MGLIKKIEKAVQRIEEKLPDNAKQVAVDAAIGAVATSFGRPLSPYDIERDRRIHVSGLLQAIISSPSITPFVLQQEHFMPVVEQELRKALALAQRIVKELPGGN